MCKKTPKQGFSHITNSGTARMVPVTNKDATVRRAIATGSVLFSDEILHFLQNQELYTPKGAVFQTAILAGTLAAKRVHELIPLCHMIPLLGCDIIIKMTKEYRARITATVSARHRTGVEMEALTAVSVSALTIYDMCKGISHAMELQEIYLLEKTGGKKDWLRSSILKEHDKK